MLVLLNGFSALPMAYFYSFLTKTAASGFALLIVLNILSGKKRNSVQYLL